MPERNDKRIRIVVDDADLARVMDLAEYLGLPMSSVLKAALARGVREYLGLFRADLEVYRSRGKSPFEQLPLEADSDPWEFRRRWQRGTVQADVGAGGAAPEGEGVRVDITEPR